jgi:hypothetical protein
MYRAPTSVGDVVTIGVGAFVEVIFREQSFEQFGAILGVGPSEVNAIETEDELFPANITRDDTPSLVTWSVEVSLMHSKRYGAK